MKNYIIYNNIHSFEDLNVLVDALSIPTINEEVENIEVEGRNGTLTVRYGNYPDRPIPFKMAIFRGNEESVEEFIERVDIVNNWLELENTNELITYLRPNKKYIVKHINKSDIAIENFRTCTIEGEFICDPFMYDANESIITLTQFSIIRYQGTVEGEPNIKIYGNGNIQLTVNDETVQINNVNQYVELDSKLLLCLNSDKTSKSRDMIGNFLLLEKGLNKISWTGNISKVELLPRTAYR